MADRPARLKRYESGYDRFVRFMKWSLPVASVLLAAMTVFWPAFNEKEISFTLSQEKIAGRRDKIRMIRPRYRGVDDAGRPFIVAAESGIQDNPEADRIVLEDIRAEMALEEGRQTRVEASRGTYIIETQELSITDGMRVVTEDGYRLEAPRAVVDLKSHMAEGTGGVTGTGPLGQVAAGRFTIRIDDQIAVFENGVSMTIRPRRDSPVPDQTEGG